LVASSVDIAAPGWPIGGPVRAIVAAAVMAAAPLGGGCSTTDRNEALVLLNVTASPDVFWFTSVRFSVPDRPAIRPHEVDFDPGASFKFGYYLPGPDGSAQVKAEALSAAGCLVGMGVATVEVKVGQVSPAVPLVIGPIASIDAACLARPDAAATDGAGVDADAGSDVAADAAGTDAAGTDAAAADAAGGDAADADVPRPADAAPSDQGPSDAATPDAAPDAPTDARPMDAQSPDAAVADARAEMPPPPPPPPPCVAAAQSCSAASACCDRPHCATTLTSQRAGMGTVCCGGFNDTCKMAGGQDCCGDLPCTGDRCCVAPGNPCSGSVCCGGRFCRDIISPPSKRCCGEDGATCNGSLGGRDCCGALVCRSGVCRR
jgi:hypothetical protein